jgi:maltooligosyltrehalose trehalohydrolase
MLFMGEEWGASTPWQFFTAHPEPELGQATAAGRIAEFERMGWDRDAVPDPQDPATFARSRLDWGEVAREPHATLFARYRALIGLRRAEPDLHSPRFGAVRTEVDEEARRLTVERGAVRIRLNLGDENWAVGGAEEPLFRTSDDVTADPVTLPPDSALVSRRRE